jgi:hypothetical protein
MTPDTLFLLATAVAACGWATLILFPGGDRRVTAVGVGIPIALGLVYCVIVAWRWHGSDGGFESLSSVARLFEDRWLLLAGWIHYLAFDLFVGGWITTDSRRHDIGNLVRVPCLLLTFIFGPAGLVMYLLSRAIRTNMVMARTSS